MKRNIEKRIEDGKKLIHKHPRADMTLSDLDYMWDQFNSEGLFLTLDKAFLLGVSVGKAMK